MRVWPELPAPGELVRLALPCPPQLVELSGYDGAGRLLARWWSPFGDELMVSDGTLTTTGRWRGWLCFCEHPLVRVFLEPYRLGDCDDEGEHRLLVDRHIGTLDVGLARDVGQLLATQPSELHALTAELAEGETQVLLQRALEVQAEREPAKSVAQLHADAGAFGQREQELLEQLTAIDGGSSVTSPARPPRPCPPADSLRRHVGHVKPQQPSDDDTDRSTIVQTQQWGRWLADLDHCDSRDRF